MGNIQIGGPVTGQLNIQNAQLHAGGVGDDLLAENGGQRDEDDGNDHTGNGKALQDLQDPVDNGCAANQFLAFHVVSLLAFIKLLTIIVNFWGHYSARIIACQV